MTIRELIAEGYSYQSTHPDKADALVWACKWASKHFLTQLLYAPTKGKWELWVK